MNDEAARLLGELVDPAGDAPRRCLDLGCGDGAAAFALAARGWHVLGVDLALPLPDGARVRVEDVAAGGVTLLRADVRTVELDERFDAIVAMGLLHSLGTWADVAGVLARIGSWSAPGATLLVSWLLDVAPVAAPHAHAFFPDADAVAGELGRLGFARGSSWDAVVEHSHGLPRHRHRVVYSVWRAR